jgi:hypothetical protein
MGASTFVAVPDVQEVGDFRFREPFRQGGFCRRPAIVLFALFDPLFTVVALPARHLSIVMTPTPVGPFAD